VSHLHYLILEVVRPSLEIYLSKNGKEDLLKDRNNLLSLLFKNFRMSNHIPVGLRLSYLGNSLMAESYQEYSFPIKGTVSHKAIILLDRNMKWPYYIGKKYVTFYSENDAAWFRLNDNDLSKYSEYV